MFVFRNLTVPPPLQKFPSFLCNTKVQYPVDRNPPFVPNLSRMSPGHTFPPCFLQIQVNIILPSTLRSSKLSPSLIQISPPKPRQIAITQRNMGLFLSLTVALYSSVISINRPKLSVPILFPHVSILHDHHQGK
jgi:hypothetical protein